MYIYIYNIYVYICVYVYIYICVYVNYLYSRFVRIFLCAPMPVKSSQYAWFKKTLRALARWFFKLFSNKQHIRAFTHIYLAN